MKNILYYASLFIININLYPIYCHLSAILNLNSVIFIVPIFSFHIPSKRYDDDRILLQLIFGQIGNYQLDIPKFNEFNCISFLFSE